MIQAIFKEVCEPCKKYINIGQSLLECEICFTAIHTKCHKIGGFSALNGLWCCKQCATEQIPRYNPFPPSTTNEANGKFYDDEGVYDDIVIHSISQVLNNCNSYSVKNLNLAIKQLPCTNNHCNNDTNTTSGTCKSTQFSSYFYNIDGNKTNFNSLCVELKRLSLDLTVIGLAETNIDSGLQNLYQIPNYTSFYQSTIDGKEKGTGVALYVNNQFNATVIESLSQCNEDIESIFVQISQPSNSMILTTGVIYRPPNGNTTKFLEHFENICSTLPDSGVRIMGDYNIDFLKMKSNTNVPSQFEDYFLSNGFYPVISTPTHSRPNCKPSCIDNILTNDIDNVLLSGTISDTIGDHMPVFEISNIHFADNVEKDKFVKYYDYSNKNVNEFVKKLGHELSNHEITENFSEFTNIFQKSLDSTCKLEKPKTTRRTIQNNPWITNGIIAACERKHELKDDWVKTIQRDHPEGDPVVRKTFTDYRRALGHIITTAKNSFD